MKKILYILIIFFGYSLSGAGAMCIAHNKNFSNDALCQTNVIFFISLILLSYFVVLVFLIKNMFKAVHVYKNSVDKKNIELFKLFSIGTKLVIYLLPALFIFYTMTIGEYLRQKRVLYNDMINGQINLKK